MNNIFAWIIIIGVIGISIYGAVVYADLDQFRCLFTECYSPFSGYDVP